MKKNGKFILVGITSVGLPCDHHSDDKNSNSEDLYTDYSDNLPKWNTPTLKEKNENQDEYLVGAYTNVASYVNWIIQNSDYEGCQLSKYP